MNCVVVVHSDVPFELLVHLAGHPASESTGKANLVVNTPEQIEIMREVGRIGREVLDIASAALRVGVTGEEIDKIVFNACVERGAYPSPLNYSNFPKSLCMCVW
jgi:methionyl aminopeptidase